MFSIEQFPLKYAHSDLAPYMSENTINYHYGRHLDIYIKNLNGLITTSVYEKLSLEDIVKKSANDTSAKKIFNNAAQIYNHVFFFDGMKPNGGGVIPASVADAFGGADKFTEQFRAAALSVFGSGWVWLSWDAGKLIIETTANADTPLAHGRVPLLALDVWEHAYYLDYQNRRVDFVDAYLAHLVDWGVVNNLITK